MLQLGVFAKYWAPGEVKTRLAAAIGEIPAARLHRVFLETLLRRFAGVGDRRVLAYSPAARAAEFAALNAPGWSLESQGDGDLGQRMQAYFRSAFAAGATRVVLIGSDSPTVPEEVIQMAFEALKDRRAVLGPATDGGYYLVGAAEAVPPIFDRMAWSQPAVWAQTVERLQGNDWDFAVLSGWYDVDEVSDLEQLARELEEQHRGDAAFEELRQATAQALQGRRFDDLPQ